MRRSGGAEPRPRRPQARLAPQEPAPDGRGDRRHRPDVRPLGAGREHPEPRTARPVGEGAGPVTSRPARRRARGGNSMTTTLEPTAMTRLDDFDYEARLE